MQGDRCEGCKKTEKEERPSRRRGQSDRATWGNPARPKRRPKRTRAERKNLATTPFSASPRPPLLPPSSPLPRFCCTRSGPSASASVSALCAQRPSGPLLAPLASRVLAPGGYHRRSARRESRLRTTPAAEAVASALIPPRKASQSQPCEKSSARASGAHAHHSALTRARAADRGARNARRAPQRSPTCAGANERRTAMHPRPATAQGRSTRGGEGELRRRGDSGRADEKRARLPKRATRGGDDPFAMFRRVVPRSGLERR